jgi:hypothetical protein
VRQTCHPFSAVLKYGNRLSIAEYISPAKSDNRIQNQPCFMGRRDQVSLTEMSALSKSKAKGETKARNMRRTQRKPVRFAPQNSIPYQCDIGVLRPRVWSIDWVEEVVERANSGHIAWVNGPTAPSRCKRRQSLVLT